MYPLDDGHHTMFTKKKSITRKEKRRLARLEKKARKTKGLESLQGNNVAEKKPKKLVKLVKEDVDGRDEKQQKLERRREKVLHCDIVTMISGIVNQPQVRPDMCRL